ncbi:unnamed protein product [Meganyctiphanes norvegica]|uniref:Secreted protein n=1 Tax=Meganyctiphanes norvegica TaxID=48144 RepID=A0AAV2QMG3_MEGNR
MQFIVGITGVLFLILASADGQRGGKGGRRGGPGGDGPLSELCESQTDTRTCIRKARTCGKELKNVLKDDFKENFEPDVLRQNVTDCATELDITLPELPAPGEGRPPGGRGPPGRRGKHGHKGGPGKFLEKLEEDIGAENATALRECLLTKQGKLDANGLVDREPMRGYLSQAFTDDLDTQTALLDALETCPEPVDFKVQELLQCLGKACIDNVTV